MGAPGARTMARRFVAGETIDDGIEAARVLVRAGFSVSLDYLGESVNSREEARAAADTYVRVLRRIGADDELREKRQRVSLKLTQMGQDIRIDAHGGSDVARPWPQTRRRRDAGEHRRLGRGVPAGRTCCASSRPPASTTSSSASTWRARRTRSAPSTSSARSGTTASNIGIVLQSYLRRTAHDVREANLLGCRVRLCKGAYTEPEQYAFPDKEGRRPQLRRRQMKVLLSDGNYPASRRTTRP
jgi:proline dehydrogenase